MNPNVADIRVLIVDDNAVNRQVLEQQLLARQMVCCAVASAEEAIHELRRAYQKDQPYQLAILDHQMPGTDGEELGCLIRDDPSIGRVPTMIMLSSLDVGTRDKLREAGFSDFLVKPVRIEELVQHIAKALAGEAVPVAQPASGKHTVSRNFDACILMAEDNAVNQKVATRILERFGCRVDTVSNGLQALEAFRPGQYDLVLMDCQMPEMDGYDATAGIRRMQGGAQVPIIALTANAMKGDRDKCLASGMNDYLSKPIDPELLCRILERWLKVSSVSAVP